MKKALCGVVMSGLFVVTLAAWPTEAATTPAASKTATPKVVATTINVSLSDKGMKTPMVTDRGLGMANSEKGAPSMTIKVSKTTVKAGDVTFKVTNSSKDTVHEVLVLPLQNAKTAPPYDEKAGEIDEDKANSLGEVSELDPGKSGSVKLTLAAGTYMLVCNQTGHYANGMWTILTVK